MTEKLFTGPLSLNKIKQNELFNVLMFSAILTFLWKIPPPINPSKRKQTKTKWYANESSLLLPQAKRSIELLNLSSMLFLVVVVE